MNRTGLPLVVVFALLCVDFSVPSVSPWLNPVRAAEPVAYRVEIEPGQLVPVVRERDGRRALYVTVPFKVRRLHDDAVVTDIGKDEIAVEEDGQALSGLVVHEPRAQELTPVLALDISGSMAVSGKLKEARLAARSFLERLDERADAGLILFDHELRLKVPPVRDRARTVAHREELARRTDTARPGGGTAYLDAAQEALHMLRGVTGRKAVVLLTDGVDMNSTRTADEVIAAAKAAGVPIYTLGVGEPGKNEPVTTVLTLDQSGSMRDPANDTDKISKMEALHVAACRYIDLMRPTARTTLMPFSNSVARPEPFGADRAALKKAITALKPQQGTRLYDAAFDAVETLVAARPEGKKAVVLLTDGKDSASRRPAEAVIRRARQAGVPLHLLGLGRKGELDEPVMRRMADQTGGTYRYAGDQKTLFDLFEKLAIDLHDDGIDEAALRRLAAETGGRYFPAHDVTKLPLLYQELAEELQTTYTVTFPSRRSSHDGTARGITISVLRGGARVSEAAMASYVTRGLVVPELDARLYLLLLAIIGVLLAVPAVVRGAWRNAFSEK
jgi:VWFA-related protein